MSAEFTPRKKRVFDRIAAWTVNQRWMVTAVVALITTGASLGLLDPKALTRHIQFATRPEVTAEGNDRLPPLPDVSPFSLSQASVVIVVRSTDFFRPETTKAMRRVVERVESLDSVREIVWMDRVPVLNIFGLQEPLLPHSEASQARFEVARRKAMAHPLVGGQLLSSDGRTTLLMVRLDYDYVFNDATATSDLKEAAQAAAAEFPGADLSFQLTGQVPAALATIESHESNQLRYQLIGYGMILIMTVVLFRGLRAVIIVAAAPAAGVFWTLGFIRFFDYQHNPLIDVILPVLISLVGLTDSVHLMVQIRKLRAGGLTSREAAQKGLQQVGMACFLTSLTTAIGFGSLMLADSEWVNQFGRCCVVGVCLTFVSVVTVIPLLCSSWVGKNLHAGQENSLIDRHLSRITVVIDAVLRRRGLLSIMAMLSTVALLAGCLTLTPDQRRTDGLPESAEATIALKHMDKAFGGLEFSRVELEWSKEVAEDSPEILVVVSKIDEILNDEELIGHPLSIRNLIDAQPGSGPPEERMSMIELLPPPLKRAFFTPEYRRAEITFRVQDLGIARYGSVFERVEKRIAQLKEQHPDFAAELHGSAVWRWRNLYQVVVDLAASLGTASVIIFIVLSFVYRSVRIGLISIIPNMFPLVLTGGFLAAVGYNLEIVMVCNFTVCLGIAVDDTIHFLTRYLDEYEENPDQDDAIRRAFTGVGTALIMTTTVLVVGFSTVIFSDSRDHRIFAIMGVLTIASALFADLIFLPALLGRFAPKKVSETHQAASGDPSVS